jgi:hypothetical protein
MSSVDAVQKAISQVQDRGFCILRNHFDPRSVEACRNAFWPRLIAYLSSGLPPNRGACRYYLAMPFEPPCFLPEFFFDPHVLAIVRGLMDDRIVADQWGCDVPVRGSQYQNAHVDYQRPLFPELLNAVLPAHAIVVSFGLVRVTPEHGPIEIAPGTHRLTRADALKAVEAGQASMRPVPLEVGDVVVRHPWALHRGTPNLTDTPRALASIRYVRRWYADDSRDVGTIPRSTWDSLTSEQKTVMRFPVGA